MSFTWPVVMRLLKSGNETTSSMTFFKSKSNFFPCLLALVLSTFCGFAPGSAQTSSTHRLDEGWEIQSSEKVQGSGKTISTDHFVPSDWYSVTVPTTVVAALVKAKMYPNPTFGTNLRNFPGMDYPISENFSRVPMKSTSPFATSWWYRKEFALPAGSTGRTIWLNFSGINYRANVWVNGRKIADTVNVAGAWRHYEFDITQVAKVAGKNVVAVEVFAPTENDLAITFVDWNPMPPDKDMGLYREVFITTSGPVAVRNPAVFSQVNSPANDEVKLSVTTQLKNASDRSIQGTLRGRIEKIEFAQDVMLAPGETKDVSFEPADFPQLIVTHPLLWWPAQMGTPNLHQLQVQFEISDRVSDSVESQFGIRQITSEVTEKTRRLFRINGKPLLIRGGGWAMDFMLRENSERLRDELNYVQDMGLNTIRLEGRPQTPEFFDETDRRGILVMAGWSCCDHWENWTKWTAEDHEIANDSLRTQMLRLRGHPSLLMWLNGSDNQPPSAQEGVYLDIEKEMRWPNPIMSSATAKLGTGGASNGARMTGPYDYVAPSYWLMDAQADQPGHTCDLGGCGGAHGFNTETSSGPAVPPVESLKAMLGEKHMWPMDDSWKFHAGGGVFKNLDIYTQALNARYGAASGIEDYAEKSQMMSYEGIRAMFEGYSRNKYVSTGVIQWMLNNAWPSVIWHLYDYYLRPGGGYFGAKIALEPLHPMYSYDDHAVWVISSQYQDVKGLKASATIYNLDMMEKFSRTVVFDAPADSTTRLFALPEIQDLTPTYFLKLVLQNDAGRTVGSNFYWMSTTPEAFNWPKSNWYTTPIALQADLTGLSQLPKIKLVTSTRTVKRGDQKVTFVTVRNPSKSLAFFIRLKLDKGTDGEEILPILWQDNYFSLLPGESREITATYRAKLLGSARPMVTVKGWNTD
jgi:exo-1,4-beta-D-glucosaminidase